MTELKTCQAAQMCPRGIAIGLARFLFVLLAATIAAVAGSLVAPMAVPISSGTPNRDLAVIDSTTRLSTAPWLTVSTHSALHSLSLITTTHLITGTLGNEGWFVSPVTVTLLTHGDAGNITTYYRLNNVEWLTYVMPITIAVDGRHVLEYYSSDGNGSEPVHTVQINIDTTPPSSAIILLPGYQAATPFDVTWMGNDNGGSGVASYDVQYRAGMADVWHDWLTATITTTATFTLAERGYVYYFQSRARDIAGNLEAFPGGKGDAATFINSIVNGDFEAGTLDGWIVTGEMSKSVTFAGYVGGSGQWSALLGSPAYGDSITPTAQLHVPTDTYASLAQTITIPPLHDLPAPALSLWYRIVTYDVVWGCTHPDRLYDSFDILVRDISGAVLTVLLRDGNYDCATYLAYLLEHDNVPPLTEIVSERILDLSPFAGRTVIIEMQNANRLDWYNNTWTYVDNVRVINQPAYYHRVILPIITVNHTMTVPAAAPALLPTGHERR